MLIIPLAVVYRYIPTLKGEAGYVQDSLKMRGFNPSLAGLVLHPVATVETFMIPLLIRSGVVKIGDSNPACLCDLPEQLTFMKAAYLAPQAAKGSEQLAVLKGCLNLMKPAMFALTCLLTIISAYLGSLWGRRLLQSYFHKAGIV